MKKDEWRKLHAEGTYRPRIKGKYGEPWEIEECKEDFNAIKKIGPLIACDDSCGCCSSIGAYTKEEIDGAAQRAIFCVNALDGIEDPAKFMELVRLVSNLGILQFEECAKQLAAILEAAEK